jgi:hypothetical protein
MASPFFKKDLRVRLLSSAVYSILYSLMKLKGQSHEKVYEFLT